MKTFLQAKVLAVGDNKSEDSKDYPYVVLLETSKTFEGLEVPDSIKAKSKIKVEKTDTLFEVKITTYERNVFYKIIAKHKEIKG